MPVPLAAIVPLLVRNVPPNVSVPRALAAICPALTMLSDHCPIAESPSVPARP